MRSTPVLEDICLICHQEVAITCGDTWKLWRKCTGEVDIERDMAACQSA